jgi:hypothetical protein
VIGALPQSDPLQEAAFGREIIADRVAGLLFECVHQIRAA